MKKIIYVLLCACMLITFVGCTPSNGGGEGMNFKGEPTYQDNKELMISGYWAPQSTDEQWKQVKDCGFTHMYLERKDPAESYDREKSLQLAEKYGIKIILQRYSSQNALIAEPIDVSKYPAFDGFNVWDEPDKEEFKTISTDLQRFNEDWNGKNVNFYSNLFPAYAKPNQLGFPTFTEYVDYYAKNISNKIKVGKKILSCDSYPLQRDATRNSNYLRSGHLFSVETIANASKKYGLEPYFFIQSMDYGVGQRAPLQADFDLQAYVLLAFGMKGIQHFTYRTPQEAAGGEFGENQTALIDRKNQKTERWEYAKKLNDELHAFDHVYLDFNWDGVMTLTGTEDAETGDFDMLKNALTSHSRIEEMESTQDTVVGCFKDSKGYEGFMVVPYVETTLEKTTTTKITFKNADSVVLYKNGVKSVETLVNGKLELQVLPGEGVFAIPFNK